MTTLYVAYGDDAPQMARRLLETIEPEQGLDKNASIGIKPNLVVAKNWRSGATTHPAVCETVIDYFQQRGYRNICVIESAWLAEDTRRAFRVCGYDDIAKKYGVELVDVKKDAYETREYAGMKIAISKRALQTDFIVNLPLIKGHCQTGLTCALKNLKGLISDSEKRRFHALGLHKPIAYLNRMIRPGLTIADGTCADPGFEEGGSAAHLGTMVAGTDSVLIDTFAAGLIGRRASDIAYIGLAEQAGVGSTDLGSARMVCVGGKPAARAATESPELQQAKARIDARDACSACYANLLSALMRLELKTNCDALRVSVGQGFKHQTGAVGSGSCTAGFDCCVKGCPPRADQIYETFLKLLRRKQ